MRMNTAVFCFTVLLTFPIGFVAETSQNLTGTATGKVAVHVYVNTGPDGFVDSPRLLDTVKDLNEVIEKRKGLVLASKDEAAITLEVISSDKVAVAQTDTSTRKGIFGGVDSTTTQKALPNITVVLRVNGSDYSKEIGWTGQLFWKDLAKRVVDQVEQWVKINGENLKRPAVK